MPFSTQKSGVKIRDRLNIYLAILIGLLLIVLLVILGINGVFSNHAKELEASLNAQVDSASYEMQEKFDTIAANSIALSQEITKHMTTVFLATGQTFDQLEDNPSLIQDIQSQLYDPLNNTLTSAHCSGVFAILDATVNSKLENASNSKTGLYLRFVNVNAENPVHQSVVLFRGIADIARAEMVEMHNRWNLEFDTQYLPWYEDLMDRKVDALSESYSMSSRMELTDTWEDISLLTVPILDNYGNVIGICGAEISAVYFKPLLPVADSPYGQLTTLVAPLDGDVVHVDQGMIGTATNTRIETVDNLTITEGERFHRYAADGETYIGTHKIIDLPSVTGAPMAVVTLLPVHGYESYVQTHNLLWIVGVVFFFLFALALVFLCSKQFMVPIEHGLKNLANGEPSQYQQSGIREFDELMGILQAKAQQIPSLTEKEVLPKNIEELIAEFTERVQTLTPTERSFLQYFIDGNDLTQISELTFISLATAKRHNTNINKKLKTSTKEELQLYIELFRRCDCLDKIQVPH